MTETVDACIIAALETKLTDLETQLAKVPSLVDALNKALELRQQAFLATPVHDDTRDAHFALQHLGQHIRRTLNDWAA